MIAGALDRWVSILAPVVSQDEFGGVVETWDEVSGVWAQYLPGAGSERFAAAAVYAETQARFLVRWRDDITTDMRFEFDGREWDILSVSEIGRRDGLEIRAKGRA